MGAGQARFGEISVVASGLAPFCRDGKTPCNRFIPANRAENRTRTAFHIEYFIIFCEHTSEKFTPIMSEISRTNINQYVRKPLNI